MPYLSRTPYSPPPYAEMEGKLMRGTTEGMYDTSVANFRALKGVAVSSIAYESDHLRVTGIEALPDDLGPGEKIPLMIYNRGGRGEYGVLSPGQVTVLMAPFVKQMRLGVLASNYRGNGGSEGEDMFGGDDVHDVLNLIALGREQEWWDGRNIFMLGWSRGGMMAYRALKEGAQVSAVAIGAGITDATGEGYARFVPKDIPDATQLLKDRSALYWAEELNAPLLILHGDADDTVDVSEARALVSTLEALGRPVKYVEYPQGDHALKKQWKEWVAETVAWFTRYRTAA